MSNLEWCRVFAGCADGGVAVPVVLDADGSTEAAMILGAALYGYATGYHMRAPAGSGCDFALRCWTEKGEIEPCAQAVLAAVWLLDDLGRLPRDRLSIWTPFGEVRAAVTERTRIGADVELVRSHVEPDTMDRDGQSALLDALGLTADDLAPGAVRVVRLDRTVALVALKDHSRWDRVACDHEKIDALSDRIESALICPYVARSLERGRFNERLIPVRPSRWREEVADGSAALALAMALVVDGVMVSNGREITILQGLDLYRASELFVRAQADPRHGRRYWLHGMTERSDPCYLDNESDFNLDLEWP